MENPIKMDVSGVPPFQETSKITYVQWKDVETNLPTLKIARVYVNSLEGNQWS